MAKAQSFLNTASTGANLINTNALKINPGDVAAQAPVCFDGKPKRMMTV